MGERIINITAILQCVFVLFLYGGTHVLGTIDEIIFCELPLVIQPVSRKRLTDGKAARPSMLEVQDSFVLKVQVILILNGQPILSGVGIIFEKARLLY